MFAGVRASPSLLLLVASTLAGCGACSGAPEEPPESASSTPRTEASGGEATRDPSIDPGPVPVLGIHGTVDRYDRSVSLRVENRGDEEVALRAALALERQRGSTWESVDATLALRDSCDADVPACVRLAPGAVFFPPAWRAVLGDAQCGCEQGCTTAPAGVYRLVVTSCSGAHRVEGEPIVLP
jgi:hypothetical protein